MSAPQVFKPLPDAFGDHDGMDWDGVPMAKSVVELEMTRLSAVLRAKPSWWTKFRNPEIRAKWRAEALAQASLMQDQHVDYVLDELDGYANLRDEESGAEVSCYDRIWQSDRLIPVSLRESLITGAAKLENVSDDQKDWHPRSNGQVLDLVHPSLYPLVYGRTISFPEEWNPESEEETAEETDEASTEGSVDASAEEPAENPEGKPDEVVEMAEESVEESDEESVKEPDDGSDDESDGESDEDWVERSEEELEEESEEESVEERLASIRVEDPDQYHLKLLAKWLHPPYPSGRKGNYYYISDRFQWLPTDFKVSEDGKSVKSLGYINNLNPIEHIELHKTIEQLIAAFIPLFERTLTDSIPTNKVIPQRTDNDCEDVEDPNEPKYDDYEDKDEYYEIHGEWNKTRAIHPPGVQPAEGYQLGSLEQRKSRYELAGRTIQVIVKLANIHLTPEKPEYPGGSWHIEGMENEAIAVSGIYYYDEENITESRLAFRTAVAEPDSYEQDDERGCIAVYGMGRDDPCVNELGSVVTTQHRCIAFPNTYQHRVSPFELADKTKAGHRKIVALFLVDPAIHRPSTTIVPPQQQEWRAAAIASNPVLKRLFDRLAPEIVDHINQLADGTMTRKEAEEYRLELMDERTAFVATNTENYFSHAFSLCEH